MTRSRFQKILIAAAYLVYLLFFLVVSKSSFLSWDVTEWIIFIFVAGFLFVALPALFSLFLHLMFYNRISYAGAFIIIH